MDISGTGASASGVGPVTRLLGRRATSTVGGMDLIHYRFGKMGSVRSLVQGFNLGRPIPPVPNWRFRDPQTAKSSGARHGRAEHRSSHGRRERSPRSRSMPVGERENEQAWATRRAEERAAELASLGPESRNDFDLIITTIYDRLETVERDTRRMATAIAAIDDNLTAVAKDFEEYKDFITGTHKVIDRYAKDRFHVLKDTTRTLTAQFESLVSALTPRIEEVQNRIIALEEISRQLPINVPTPASPVQAAEIPAGYGALGRPAAPGQPCQSAGQAEEPPSVQAVGDAEQFQIHTQPRHVANDPWAPAAQARFGDK